jgi:hypothetical protein
MLIRQHTGVRDGAIVRNKNMGHSFKQIVLVLYTDTLHVNCPVCALVPIERINDKYYLLQKTRFDFHGTLKDMFR